MINTAVDGDNHRRDHVLLGLGIHNNPRSVEGEFSHYIKGSNIQSKLHNSSQQLSIESLSLTDLSIRGFSQSPNFGRPFASFKRSMVAKVNSWVVKVNKIYG